MSTKGRIRRHLPAGRSRSVAFALALTGLLAGAGATPAWAQMAESTTATSTTTTTIVLPPNTVVGPSTPTGLPPVTGLPTSTTTPTGTNTTGAAPPTTPPTTTIRSQQDHVVTAAHMIPLYTAGLAVEQLTADVGRDTKATTADHAAETAAAAALATAAARLTADQATLALDRTGLTTAHHALDLDQARLGALALAMYTGALTSPQPASLDLQADQEQIIDDEEADIVAGQVDYHLHLDEADVARDLKRTDQVSHTVDADQQARSRAAQTVTDAARRTTADQATLVSDRERLAGADRALDTAEASLAAALVAVHGPSAAPPGQLSLLGAAALDAAQLVAWYNSQGYVDLTSASIQDLANWYIQAGAEEGVRGDVAFAQAVLETGGFASPDAVVLSNFAGIGHCDTCASGWAFPSPRLGVLGHIQLLRIFADKGPGPAHAPPPVLPVLVPAHQGKAGCCSTVESLTGVWATDPTYGQQILVIYASMLASALSPD